MDARLALLAVLSLAISGCIGDGSPLSDLESDDPTAENLSSTTSVHERAQLPFNTTGTWSHVLEPGSFDILEPLSINVPVDLPAEEGGAAVTGDAQVHMGLFLPDIEGCDWESDEIDPACQVPVIADVGPYYGDGDVPADQRDSGRLGEFLISEFVPQGYAVAQVSVFGSGQSNHCMDLMGQSEQLGIDAAVTFLGEAAWSNGNVGMIGRSYDGSTPWEAATFGNPHLETIVPISGLIGMHELMWRNGSAEFRGPIMHNGVYGTFGIDTVDAGLFGTPGVNEPDSGDAHTLCKDYLAGPAQGAGAYATGDHVAPEVNDYWQERYFLDRALENYDGSVYLIQGLQDWNVDPHMAVPTHQMVEDAGLEIKGLYGQWDHAYPDRVSDHADLDEGYGQEAWPSTVRYDWAQDLTEWFDHYLKGTGAQPDLHVEVQDNQGQWRVEETYPPADRHAVELTLGDSTGTSDAANAIGGAGFLGVGPETTATFEWGPLSETNDTLLTGTQHFHVQVTPTGPGGQLFAELRDADTGLHLGHAVMDLRFHDGGNQMQPVVPGQPIVAQMEFFALDAVLPAGHGLELVVSQTGMDYLPPAVNDPVMIDTGEASVLRVFTTQPAQGDYFTPPTATMEQFEEAQG